MLTSVNLGPVILAIMTTSRLDAALIPERLGCNNEIEGVEVGLQLYGVCLCEA